MSRLFYICWCLWLCTGHLHGQQYRINEIKNVVAIDRDEKGNVFLADDKSNVYKFDSTLNFRFVFSPNFPAYPDVLDASTTTKILVFNENRQEYRFLDWLLSPISRHDINPRHFEYVSLITQSAQNYIWVLDNVRFTLSKVTPDMRSILVETHLETIVNRELSPLYMKEYNNSLYLSTEQNGILVFDNMGNYKKKLPFNGVDFFTASESGMFLTSDNELIRFDLENFRISTLLSDFEFSNFLFLNGKIIVLDPSGTVKILKHE